MTFLIGTLTLGLVFGVLALGVYLSYKVFRFPDITVDGTFALGAAVSVTLMVKGAPEWMGPIGTMISHPVGATLVGAFAGAIAGAVTGLLHTTFKIEGLLAGILVMTGLYTVNLRAMGQSNVPIVGGTQSLKTMAESLANPETAVGGMLHKIESLLVQWGVLGFDEKFQKPMIYIWTFNLSEYVLLFFALLVVSALCAGLYYFLKTDLGTAMRATGDNPQMIRALGTNTGLMITLGLALSNGFAALAGALFAQYQGFADAQMGIGMIVWGLASVILGEALIGKSGVGVGLALIAAITGSILFRLMVGIALMCGLNPNDLKLITAVFVFVALVMPGFIPTLRTMIWGRIFLRHA